MSIVAGSTILAADFVSTSAGAGDSGKAPKLNSSGVLDATFVVKPKVASGATTHDISSVTAQTIAHGLGVTPRLVRITIAYYGGGQSYSNGVGVYSGGAFSAVTLAADKTSGSNVTAEASLKAYSQIAATEQSNNITIGAPDATNINLTFSKSGAPTGNIVIVWEAFE